MWNSLVIQPLAFIINTIYDVVQNYGLAIVLFTIVVKAILMPLNIKGIRSSMEIQRLQPKLKEIQEKYKDDKEKMVKEQQKLYDQEKINPLAGCLPQLIPMIIMIALYYVVAQPMTHILHMDKAAIEGVYNQLSELGVSLQAFSFYNFRQVDLMNLAMQNNLNIPTLNFDFLGLNMAVSPLDVIKQNVFSFYWILPIITVATAWFSQKLMLDGMPKNDKKPEEAMPMQTTMKIMPWFSGWITFQFSTALGMYWIVSNITQILQQLYVNKHIRKPVAEKGK